MILLARSVAHLYAIAGVLASRCGWDADECAAELGRVVEMLQRACDRLEGMPDCAASVLEQCVVVSSVQAGALADVQAAMALARAGLVINTWCTATTMLVSTQATDGPLTIGGLVQLVGTVQPDARHRAAVGDKLAAVAYDNSAARQLGTCYFQAYEGFSLLELHRLLSMGDASHAADLLDNARRGALTAVRFLERAPLGQAEADDSGQADEAATDDRDGDQADDHAQAQADDHAQADEQDHSDGAQAEVGDSRDGQAEEADDSNSAQARPRPTTATAPTPRPPPATAPTPSPTTATRKRTSPTTTSALRSHGSARPARIHRGSAVELVSEEITGV